MDKVIIFCDHSMTLREMTDNLLTVGHFWTPPPPLWLTIMNVTLERFLFHCVCYQHKRLLPSKPETNNTQDNRPPQSHCTMALLRISLALSLFFCKHENMRGQKAQTTLFFSYLLNQLALAFPLPWHTAYWYVLNRSLLFKSVNIYVHYGNTGCRVFKWGVQNQKDFCKRINIPKGNY